MKCKWASTSLLSDVWITKDGILSYTTLIPMRGEREGERKGESGGREEKEKRNKQENKKEIETRDINLSYMHCPLYRQWLLKLPASLSLQGKSQHIRGIIWGCSSLAFVTSNNVNSGNFYNEDILYIQHSIIAFGTAGNKGNDNKSMTHES